MLANDVIAISAELEKAIGETIGRITPEVVEDGANYFKIDVLFYDGFNIGVKVNIDDFESLKREEAIERLSDSLKNAHLEAKIGSFRQGEVRGSVNTDSRVSANYLTDTSKKAFDPESIGVDTIVAVESDDEVHLVFTIGFEDGTAFAYLVKYDLFRDKGIEGAAHYIREAVRKIHEETVEAIADAAKQEKSRWN